MTVHRITLFICGTALLATAALAGEVNGSKSNPKDDFSNGVSICKFSGLNDFPDGSESGPPGRTQNYGQDVRAGRADPQEFNPGDEGACNAHLSPFREPGNPNGGF
ncbi:MAG: hypothetical protein ACJ8EH_03280 [Sphingomicrobium sp.]|jgi:hypothetical protein